MTSKRNPRKKRQREEPPLAKDPPGEAVRRCLLGAVVALVVARPFTPSVGLAQYGHGEFFILLWLLLLASWIIATLRRDGKLAPFRMRPDVVDAAVTAIFTCFSISGVVAVFQESPRPALNSSWQWGTMFLTYILVRQLVVTRQEMKAIVAVMIALSTAFAAIGLEQNFVSIPASQKEFAAVDDNPVALFQLTGEWLPQDSPERQRFESRLFSGAPTATFALANSLAGFIAPWFAILCGVVLCDHRARRRWPYLTFMAVLLMCLIFTGSRSALLAAFIGVTYFLIDGVRRRFREKPRLVGATIMLPPLILIAGTAITRFAAPKLYGAAAKSLQYRIEYWRATWAMIRNRPLLGCGPGQFQDAYTKYKLPSASEEIADPHNFLFEIWATAGSPALIATLFLIGMITIRIIKKRGDTRVTHDKATNRNQRYPNPTHILVGGLVGLTLGPLLAWLDQTPVAIPHVAITLLVGPIVALSLIEWTHSDTSPAPLLILGLVVLLINLLFAGGIGEPGIANTVWILIALLNTEWRRPTTRSDDSLFANTKKTSFASPAMIWGAALVICLVAVIAAYYTAFAPVIMCRTFLSQAESPERLLLEPDAVENNLAAAVAADRWSALAARRLADAAFASWEREPNDASRDRWRMEIEDATKLAPRSARMWRAKAVGYEKLWKQSNLQIFLDEAIQSWSKAITNYPTNARFYAEQAKLLQDAGRRCDAVESSYKALQYDDAKRNAGHVDQYLTDALREEMKEMTRKPNELTLQPSEE